MSVRLIIEKLSKISNLFSPDESNTCWQNDERYQIKTRNDKITVMWSQSQFVKLMIMMKPIDWYSKRPLLLFFFFFFSDSHMWKVYTCWYCRLNVGVFLFICIFFWSRSSCLHVAARIIAIEKLKWNIRVQRGLNILNRNRNNNWI